MNREIVHLDLILRMIAHIERRLAGIRYDQFARDEDEIDLTSFRLSVIGETANKLSAALKLRRPEIDWTAMYAMRNIIAHDYLGINERRVWRTATGELADLKRACQAELADD